MRGSSQTSTPEVDGRNVPLRLHTWVRQVESYKIYEVASFFQPQVF